MAKVTMELRNLLKLENFKIFDFDYEITDAGWKAKLEQAFIDEFYFNEIGQETPDRWKHYVKRKFVKIMPYYNKLYQSTLQEVDPLITYKRKETYDGTNINSGTTATTDNSKSYEYPQNANPLTDIASGMDDGKSSSTSGSNSAINYEKIIEGLDGDQNALMKSYRENILRINEMILRECKDLFILVY